MIFIDLIWLFIFMVLIDSRPTSKSMDDLNNVKHDNRNDHIHPSAYGYNHYAVKYAHVSNKPHSKKTHEEIDLSGFQKYITQQVNDSYKDSNVYQSNLNNNISIWLQELTTALGGLKQLYGIEVTSTPTTTEQITKNVKEHFESEFYLGGTAEIETVLSEIKEKALQIMLQQIPSAADIISNAVTETTFDMASMISTPRSHGQHLNIPHNRNMRSIYYHAATLAHQLECDLQEKCKNAYYKMKHKISHDLEEEIIHSKNAIKEALNKLQKSQLHNTMKNKGIVDKTTLSTKMLPIVKTRESPNYKSQKKNPKKKLFTKRTTTVNKSKAHVIPKVTDDYSMLSVYEKLLLKSHDNDVMKQLTTHNVPMNDYKLEEKISKRNHESLENINLKRSVQKLYDDDQMPDVVDYNEENNATSDSGATRNVAISKKVHTSTNDEISYNTLSNKISYNDYVNGFKYYLNFQKDQENQNFSNLVRYQAHRHHSVDDVGKYILEKLPKLPTTRKKRYLFEQETLEDQDISTKSDDSWFKKHFYVFIDKDPPKKFHTAQTVSLKEDRKEYSQLSTRNSDNNQLKNFQNKHKQVRRSLKKFKISNNSDKLKTSIVSPATTVIGTYATKNGYVDVNLVHKPTGVIKLKSNKDKGNKKRKYKNFFKKISFHSKNPKKYSKRNLPTRKRRSNPFKVLKDIVFRNRYTDSDNKVRKLFDYDIVASSFNPNCKYIDVNRNTQLPNIDAMLRQIPNITSNLESLLDYGYTRHYVSNNLPTRKYVHNKGLYYTKPGKYYVSNDKIDLTDKEMTAETQNYDYPNYYFNKSRVDDIINIRIKTADQINIKPLKTTKVTNIRYEATQNRMDPLLESLLGGQTPKTTKLLKTTQFPGYYLVSDGNLQISQSGRGKPVKEKAKNKKSYLEYNRPSIKVIDSLGKLYNYKVIHNGKEKEQYRRNENFISRASHKYHLSKTHNSEKKSKNIDKTVKPTTSDKKKVVDQSQNRNQVENMKQLNDSKRKDFSKHIDKSSHMSQKEPKKKISSFKAPDHYFSTPLPMSPNEFNKFLEENQIDVQSVTSPLPNFIPFSTQVPSNRVKPVHYGPEYRKQTTHNMKNTPSRSNGNFAYDYTYYPKEGKRKRRGNEITGKLPTTTNNGKHISKLKTNLVQQIKQKRTTSDDLFKGRGSNFQTFTAKDVAALEIIIDLRKHNQEYNEKETQNVSLDRNAKLIYEQDDKQKVTNSIQVHIALPDNADNFKRSPESVQVKKVFSAIMASPIDIAYQLHAFEKSTVLTPTTIGDSKLSPGLYLLVEKDNASYPEEQLILKPIKMKKNPSLSVQTAGNMSDFIDPTVDDVLDSTMTSEYENYVNGKSEHKRSISWDSIKKFFGHDRVCNCRCKANQTMCKACAASNAVITELIFEFDNLAKYMRDHCTEIQTFFWMNPTGGKKLREVVNKINKSLNDYYKRVKGKCQGRTCKMFSSGVDKRSSAQQFHKIRNKFEINTFLTALSNLSDDLDYVLTLGLLDEGIQNSGYLVQKIFDQCLSQSRFRRSFMDQHKKCKPSSSYSLENININLLCSSNTVKTTTSNYNHDTQDYTNRDNITPIKEIYSNYLDGKKLDQRNEKKKTLKDFIKRRFKQKQSQIFSAKHVQPRYKRKTFSKPIVNVLLLNNRSNKTKTDLNTKLLKHQSTREIKEMEKTTTNLNNLYTDNDLFVHNFNELFRLLGNSEVNDRGIFKDLSKKIEDYNNSTYPVLKTSPKKTFLFAGLNKLMRTHNQYTVKTTLKLMDTSKSTRNIVTTKPGPDIYQFTKDYKNSINFLSTNKNITEQRFLRNTTSIYTTFNDNLPKNKLNSHVITNVTIKENPTIIIIDRYNSKDLSFKTQDTGENELRSLLLSILNYNSKIINNEWIRAVNFNTDNTNTTLFPLTDQKKEGFIKKWAHKFSRKNITSEVKKKERCHKTQTIETNKPHATSVDSKVKGTANKSNNKTTKTTSMIDDKNLKYLCDISSTVEHVMSRRNLMNEKKFEEYVKNVNCYKLASIPEKFLIKFNKRGNKRRHRVCMRESNDNTALRKRQIRDKILPRDDVRLELDDDYGFDVIRHRRERQLLGSDYIYEVHEHRNDLFEKYERGAEGLYKETLLRVKRSNSAEDLIHKLTNLPPLRPLSDEVFAMIGDSLSMGCYPSGYNYSDVEQENLNWMTDRDNVENKNVFTNGSVLHLRNLLKRDSGIYSCYDHNIIVRSVKVNVIDVPNFNVVFTPVYRTSSSCSYKDLRAIQKVGVLMRQLTCGNYCSVRIDEPVCLRNKEDDTYLLRTITVLIPQYKRIVNCTAECQRNLRSSLAVLFARNAPVLASIPVVMAYYDGSILEEIKTWTPSSRVHKSFVSHTLRTRDTNGHQEYNSLAANSEPNSIHVVVACPAGFFLVSTQKICGICPPNTYSAEADNACTSCPEGTVSDAGSGGCHLTLSRLRRSFCYEPCILVKTIGFITLVTIIYYTASRLRRYLAVCCKTEDLTENFSPKQKGKPRSFQGGPAHHVTHHSERKKYPPLPPIDF